jgi:hypothetical protein
MKAYDSLEEFKRVTVNVLKKQRRKKLRKQYCLAEYIAEQPNIRDRILQTDSYANYYRPNMGIAAYSHKNQIQVRM